VFVNSDFVYFKEGPNWRIVFSNLLITTHKYIFKRNDLIGELF